MSDPPLQFTNTIYFLNVDSANPSSIYIYDAAAKSWSTQAVDAGKFDPTNFAAILDHDTNVFCGLTFFIIIIAPQLFARFVLRWRTLLT
jgi:hypothetical protein